MEKNNSKGFIIPLVIIISVIVSFGLYVSNRENKNSHNNITISSKQLTSTSTIKMNNDALTEKEILSQVYSISINYNGKKIAPQFVEFSPKFQDNTKLTGVVYLHPYNNAGKIDVVTNAPKVGFWISKYEFTDENHFGAKVYVAETVSDKKYTFTLKKSGGKVAVEAN